MIVHQAESNNDYSLQMSQTDSDAVHSGSEFPDIGKQDTVVEASRGTMEEMTGGSFHIFFGKIPELRFKVKDIRPVRHIL